MRLIFRARIAAPLSLVALLAACASQVELSPVGPSPATVAGRQVAIERTAYGIAHITATDYEGLAYGTAYAQAQDLLCQTAEQVVTVRGERSEFFGAGQQGLLGLRTLPNAQIDLFIRSHMDDAALATAWSRASPEAQAALRGYVAGYNRYLRDTPPAARPAECRDATWVRPMTLTDMQRMGEQSMILGGLGALADAVLAAQPPAARTGEAPQRTVAVAGSAVADQFDPVLTTADGAAVTPEQAARALAEYRIDDRGAAGGELGSNGWAFGRNTTPDGSGVLLGNPHFPWVGSNRFWQMHLTIPGQLDVMGATTGAGPVVTIGFNRDVAWTHTVSTGKRFTLHELKLDPADPTVYLLDGQKRKMEVRTVSVPAAGGAPATTRTLYRSDWGPIVVIPRAGLNWTASTAYALQDVNTLNTRWLEMWQRMGRARTVQELLAAMSNQGMPWVNTIAADRAGNALYTDSSAVPDVSAEQMQRCAPSPAAAALWRAAGLPVLDGSRSECGWRREPGVAAPGVTPPARLPAIVTPEWVQNSNDSFWLSNPAISPPTGISPLVGLVGTQQRLRTRSGIQEIQARLAGTDGLAGNKMGSQEVRSLIFRNKNLAGMLVMDDLNAACVAAGVSGLTLEQREGCSALARWDRTSDTHSAGAPLFREFWRKAKDIAGVWRVPFNPAQPVATPAGLAMQDAVVRAAVFKALGDAVGVLKAAGYAPDATLSAAQFREVRGQRVAIHGGDEFEGVLNKVESQGQPQLSAGGYRINYGSSYMQVVGFDAAGPRAYGLLTYGQGSSPASPHAYDQLPLFSAKQWVPLPFHPAEVRAQRVGAPLMLRF